MKRAALLLAVLALAACGGEDEDTAPPGTAAPIESVAPTEAGAPTETAAPTETVTPAADVETLDNVLALRSDFEADAGKTRVIILLSPT